MLRLVGVIARVKKGLTHQGLVVSIIDKNKASLVVLCPVMLHRVLVKMYPVGETYEKVEETEEQVLNRMVKSSVKVFKDIRE